MWRAAFSTAVILALLAPIHAQRQAPALVGAQFDVVSIKPHKDDGGGGGMRTQPDGTFMMTNQPIGAIVGAAAPFPVGLRDIVGLPEWAMAERYDVIAKPAPGPRPTPEQRSEMMRNMLIERMKLAAHVEERERDGFALVVARSDGRLGPQLKASTVDCKAPVDPAARGQTFPSRCGMRLGAGSLEVTGLTIEQVIRSFSGPAGGPVTNRTGLDGAFDFTLHYAPPGLSAAAGASTDNGEPQFVTAVQEQLGLKLVPEKMKVRVFVIDHIERPTPD
jgi:uncharacterized protein (TIGR03435 family)